MADDIVAKVGKQIRLLRGRRQLTQAALAELAELAPHTLSRVERGEQGLSLKALDRMAKALDVPVATLFLFDGVKSTGAVDGVMDALPEDPAVLVAQLRAALETLVGQS